MPIVLTVVHDCRFVFVSDAATYGVIACDQIKTATKWLRGAAESSDKFSMTHELSRAVLVGRAQDGTLPEFLPGGRVAVIVDSDPHRAAERALANLEGLGGEPMRRQNACAVNCAVSTPKVPQYAMPQEDANLQQNGPQIIGNRTV